MTLTILRIGILLLLVTGLPGAVTVAQTPVPVGLDSLRSRIVRLLAGQQGHFAVVFRDLSSPRALEINSQEVFHAASTMKLAVMIELYRQRKQRRLSWRDSLDIHSGFRSIVDGSPYQLDSADDSETELYRHLGERRSLGQLVYLMITLSSNLATNLLMERVGADQVMKTLRVLGTRRMQVLRGVEDNKAFERGLNNTVSADDLALLLEKMARGELVSRRASRRMVRILLDQRFNEIIPAGLPPGVRVAHKTGSITGVEHDAGIVLLPDGREYVLVLLSRDLQDPASAVRTLAEVSRQVYLYYTGQEGG